MGDINSTFLEDPRLNANAGFATTLRSFIKQKADTRERAFGNPNRWQREHLQALRALVAHIEEVDPVRSRPIAILYLVNVAAAEFRRERVRWEKGQPSGDEPGIRGTVFDQPIGLQNYILETLGDTTHPAPRPEQTLLDLATAGAKGLAELSGKEGQREREASSRLRAELDQVTADLEQNRVDAARIVDLEAEVEALRGELGEKDQLLEVLRASAGEEPKRPRRTMIEPKIYRASSGKLEVAEAAGGGKTKFHVVETLGEARLLREELHGDATEEPPEIPEADLEAACDTRERELGRELSAEEVATVEEELAKSTAAATEAGV